MRDLDTFMNKVSIVSDFIWGFPMISLFLSIGIYISFQLRWVPFVHIGHIAKNTLGSIFKKTNSKNGEVSPFAAFTSALSATAGATNIVGVPVAIAFGGPGALFWMWVVAFIGMSTLFAELVLGIKYRTKNDRNEWIGGPRYYLSQGLGWKKIGWIYSFGLMLEVIPSVMVQANSVAEPLKTEYNFSPWIIGLILSAITCLIVFGGIKRIGKISAVLLPIFVILYIGLTLTVIVMNSEQLPSVFALIFTSAFTQSAAVGTFAGAAVVQTMRWGLARGLYTSEAGMGTSAIAYASADTDEPVKQSFWGIIAVFIDTLLICSLTGITVIITGVWKEIEPSNAASMVSFAFKTVFNETFSGVVMAVLLLFFVLATVGVIIYYGESQGEQLFGRRVKYVMRFIYLVAIIVGAIGGLKFVWELLDIMLAIIVIPNIIGIMLLTKYVKEEKEKYFEKVKKSEH
ncbi:alanine/glycine:cation symporter family protein [Bacillus coahuilensis]|uniref:alanine/glycine:cation symporter family protein n=1 Tax=Bacillus coahuilensis TaxID=408580 RepID=UPI001F4CE191|nr:amino acid carrier protein [Bacillus coahuilensis]